MFKQIRTAIKSTHKALKKQSETQTIGNTAEQFAKEFLLAKGLNFVTHQFRTPMGEIDLIMKDKKEIVFVEVRFRKNDHFGEGYETVTHSKQQRLIRTALYYQKCYPWALSLPCRFDVVSILGEKLNPKITWIPNAFGVE